LTHYFKYYTPASLDTALKLLRQDRRAAKVIAGGTDLKLLIDDEVVHPDLLVDLSGIEEMTKISDSKNGLVIGGGASLVSIQNSDLVRRNALALAEAASSVGSMQIRNIATIGGNLANASPAADTPPALMVLGAEVTLASASRRRSLPIDKLFVGVKKTCLASFEIITEIRAPHQKAGTGTAFLKFGRGFGPDLAQVNVAAAVNLKDGNIHNLKVAFGAVAPTPVRARHLEAALRGAKFDRISWDEIEQEAMKDIRPITDVRTTEAHRRVLCAAMLGRAIRKAAERTKSEEA
jgi:CO/xanthine dehydrogenase FAD-binding subunit